ncbi:hypothetical protein AbraIFM66950_010120 [Aspergillus brasiliensis]|nr:hypothetical protein AbraIFM66950_010120 [Aspergillus brasiliensis]
MDVEEIKKRMAKELEEYRSIIQGTDLYDYMGHRVVESRTTSGNLVAVKKHEAIRSRNDASGVIAMVTDRVPGESLDKVWHALTKPQKKNIELQLKQQVQEMRKHTQPYIGQEDFDEWCFARVKFSYQKAFWKRYLPRMRNKKPSKFVLTHGDLAARNIMVKDGQLTDIVDWEYSGFFPEYMEYALATVIHDGIEDWWLPVLKRVLEPSGYLRSKFIATIKDRGW